MKTKPLREVIAERLADWMRDRIDLDTQVKLSNACGLGQSSIQRILHSEVNPTVESLEQIANAFGREVGDLCIRDDTANIAYDRARYRKLPDYEKARVEGFVKHVIAQHNATPEAPLELPKASTKYAAPLPVKKRTRRLTKATKVPLRSSRTL